MPWCDPCGRFYNPNTLHADGACPACGSGLADQGAGAPASAQKVPWHFWLLLAGLAIYLGWRLVQVAIVLLPG
jgi:hypothetical protein